MMVKTKTMKQREIIVWIGSISALILGAVSGLILTNQTAITRVSMIFSVAAMLLSLFAVPFFLTGLKRFKKELQRTYLVLCVGVAAFGFAQIQLPIINLFNIAFWVNSGAIALPYLIGVICIFWSMKELSRLLAIKSVWRSGTLAFIVTVLLSAGAALLPHVAISIDELSYHIALALSIWNSVFITFATVLAFRVRNKIGVAYTTSLNWLSGALAVLSFAGWHYTVVQLLFTVGDWYYDYSIALIPFIFGGLALVMAGFSFGSIDTIVEEKNTAPTPTPVHPSPAILSPAQELDVIVYVTNLVSNPEDIDILIDKVHSITSKLSPGATPSPEDQKTLDSIYVRLEDYLVHQDPLRVFTREELHARIAKRFGFSDSVKTTLWNNTTSDISPIS